MKYKEAKKIVDKTFPDVEKTVIFGWRFRIYPRLRKQIKSWANQMLEDEKIKPKCSFCGRKLILYKQEWICGHGCTKPAVKSDELKENNSKSLCEICWKSFRWACPLLLHHPINIILCSAYEPTDAYIKEQELTSKFIKKLDYIMERIEFHTENPDSELMDEVVEIYKEYKNKERIIK